MSETDYIMEDWTLDPRNGRDYDPEFDEELFGLFEVTPKTCNRCGCTGLEWVKHKGKWRLADGNGLHECDPNKAAAKVFKVIK